MVVSVTLAVIVVAVLVFVPVISATGSYCGTIKVALHYCVPDEVDSIGYHYLGFGVYSSYNGSYYYFCTSQISCQSI